jgi:ABC-type sugar transport system permease subunit
VDPLPAAPTDRPGPGEVPEPDPGDRHLRRRRRERLLAAALLAPSALVFAVFVFYPFARNIYLSLYSTPPFPNLPSRFVGLSQYSQVLGSHNFLNSLWVTALFVVYTVPAGLLAGLLLALLAFRTVFASPVATSVAVASVIFFTLLNPQVGLFTYWLGQQNQLSVLDNPTWALVAVSVVTVWQNIGLSFILMSAGLQAVPDELLEACEIDGAKGWARLRHVVVPLLSPTIFFAVVVGTILSLQSFGQIDLLTQGGPLQRTNLLVYNIYDQVFNQNNEGRAAVMAIALFFITLVLALVQIRLLERRVTYGN